MAASSSMRALGAPLPTFSLPDTVSGRIVSSSSAAGAPATLIAFICNHCPYVVHVRDSLVTLANEFIRQGVWVAAISSNDAGAYPQDGPDRMREDALRFGYPFPYLYDESQQVARAFEAACTPDFFAFDAGHELAYRGQFDDSRPSNGRPVTGADLRAALQALLRGERPSPNQRPSMGCSLKWKSGEGTSPAP